jgi:hypothetical protein
MNQITMANATGLSLAAPHAHPPPPQLIAIGAFTPGNPMEYQLNLAKKIKALLSEN